MKLVTVIKALETARLRFIAKHGVEPHVAPSLAGNFGLCKNVGECPDGSQRFTAPIEPIKIQSVVKFASFVKGKSINGKD